ncbi:hypothetical protein [Aliidongia dinghuensis]|uniref:hypothetical protein n=1 Tax=Aliidongia dinghuensis TaxID=1867774 RepID=UPI00166CB080|nr:hypothetical protein [Aliidongia dinghuensis]
MKKNQRKRERILIRRLVDGLAGWLTFKQAGAARTLYCEHFLYPPIYEIASGRGWSVLAQEPITTSSARSGAPSTLDFVFFEKSRNIQRGSRGLIMIEIKYIRGDNITLELQGLYDDFTKLRTAVPNVLRSAKSLSSCGDPDKWQIVVAQRKAYNKISRSRSKKFPEIVKLLTDALSDKPSQLLYRSIIETKLKSDFHWHVIAIGENRWSNTLS